MLAEAGAWILKNKNSSVGCMFAFNAIYHGLSDIANRPV